jgi:hypothetical protein
VLQVDLDDAGTRLAIAVVVSAVTTNTHERKNAIALLNALPFLETFMTYLHFL